MLMSGRQITIELDEFGYSELEAIANRQGVSIEDLVAHAAIYYLAHAESGTMATKVPPREGDRPAARRPS